MARFDFYGYMETLAVQLKELRHTEEKPKYHRSTILTDFEEFMANSPATEGYNLIAVDGRDYTTIDSGNGPVYKRRVYTFFIVKNCGVSNADAREETIVGSELIVDKIISRMFRDQITSKKEGGDGLGLRNLDRNSILCGIVGPLFNEWWGMSCSFTLIEMKGLVFNESDWDG